MWRYSYCGGGHCGGIVTVVAVFVVVYCSYCGGGHCGGIFTVVAVFVVAVVIASVVVVLLVNIVEKYVLFNNQE